MAWLALFPVLAFLQWGVWWLWSDWRGNVRAAKAAGQAAQRYHAGISAAGTATEGLSQDTSKHTGKYTLDETEEQPTVSLRGKHHGDQVNAVTVSNLVARAAQADDPVRLTWPEADLDEETRMVRPYVQQKLSRNSTKR